MSEYRIAKGVFSEGGKPYPVNCKYHVDPGDFVIVRVEDDFTRLRKAKVVKVEHWKAECKNSVVCRAEREAAYGGGPDAITNEQELERFLLEYLRFIKIGVCFRKTNNSTITPHPEWHVAFVKLRGTGGLPSDGFASTAKIFVLGTNKYRYDYADNGQILTMHEGKLLLRENGSTRFISPPSSSCDEHV